MVREAGDLGGTPLIYFHGTPSMPAGADVRRRAWPPELGHPSGLVRPSRLRRGRQPVPFSLASIARDTGLRRRRDWASTRSPRTASRAVVRSRWRAARCSATGCTRVGVTCRSRGRTRRCRGSSTSSTTSDRGGRRPAAGRGGRSQPVRASASSRSAQFGPAPRDADIVAGFKSMSSQSRRAGPRPAGLRRRPLAAAMRAALVQGTSRRRLGQRRLGRSVGRRPRPRSGSPSSSGTATRTRSRRRIARRVARPEPCRRPRWSMRAGERPPGRSWSTPARSCETLTAD